MKGVLVFVAVVAVLLFASCGGIFPTGPKPEDLAKALADKIMELVESGGVQLTRNCARLSMYQTKMFRIPM